MIFKIHLAKKMFFKIIVTFLFLKSLNSLEPNKFCFLNDYSNLFCKKYDCGQNLCSLDEKSCTNLRIWNNLLDKYVPHVRDGKFLNFFSKIKECKMNDHSKLSSIVCSNKLKCNRENQNFFRYMIGLKPKECSCSRKFNHDCGNEFCSINQNICDALFKSNKNSILKSKKIKYCE